MSEFEQRIQMCDCPLYDSTFNNTYTSQSVVMGLKAVFKTDNRDLVIVSYFEALTMQLLSTNSRAAFHMCNYHLFDS